MISFLSLLKLEFDWINVIVFYWYHFFCFLIDIDIFHLHRLSTANQQLVNRCPLSVMLWNVTFIKKLYYPPKRRLHPRLQYFLPYKTQFTTLAYSMPVKWPLGFSHPTFCLSASFNHNVEDIIQLPQMSYFDQSLPYHTKELVILFRELYQEFFFFF